MSELEARAKALQILLNLDPEEGLEEYIKFVPCGLEGEYDAKWDTEKLKLLFNVANEYEESPFAKLSLATEAEYWKLENERMNHENLRALTTRLINDIDNERVDINGHTITVLRTYIKD